MIEFFVPGEIKPKGNSKNIVRSKSGQAFLVEPAANTANANALRVLFAQHAPPKPIEGAVWVCYQIQYAWRKGDSKKTRELRMVPKDTAPDLGNLEKQLDDALQAAGFLVNDSQIAARGDHGDLRHGKFLCDSPGVHVQIVEL
jgi:Holliday junction resolvase RusA-like endonuclease